MSNQRHKIFALNLFVGSCAPSSKLYQSGINKGNHLSVFIINHPKSHQRISLEIYLMIKTLEKLGRTMNLTRIGIQINPRYQFLMNMELLSVHFFYHLNKMAEICLKIKSLIKLGEKMNLTNMGRPIYPIWQSLLNMIFIVTYLLYHPNKMAQMTLLVIHLL